MFVAVQFMLKGPSMLQYFCTGRYNQRIVRESMIWMMSCEKATCDELLVITCS
uniref:Dihydrodipicolinate reductase n=1 Tax=Arundo donax TaxID=35708 RepID=A0A0A9DZZ2_ARUDO